MHPLHRLLIGISLSLLVYLCIRERQLNSRVTIVLLWDVFALAMILTSWIVIFSRETNMIRKQARKQDGSVIFVFALIFVSSFASLLIVMLLIVSKNIGILRFGSICRSHSRYGAVLDSRTHNFYLSLRAYLLRQ